MIKVFKNIIYFSSSFIIVLILLELFVRFAYIETQSPTDFTEEYGRCRRENMDYVYFNEGFSMGNFNEGRYVNSYYSINKPKGIIRIAALGDSYVEGFQVFERNHFLKIAESRLNKSLNDSIQILNFGRSGFDFGDMYAYYDRIVKQYNCDYILFFISNADLNIKQTDPLIPKVTKKENQIIVSNELMPLKYKSSYIKILNISHFSTLYLMLNNSRKLITAGELYRKLFDKFYFKSIGKESQGKTSEVNISGLAYDLLNQLSHEKPKIIIINRDRNQIKKEFLNNIEYPIIFYDLMQESDLYNQAFDPHYFKATNKTGHWNKRGNKIVGESLSRFIENLN